MEEAYQELNADELDTACGGMKADKNYVSNDVIDARGGFLTVWGVTLTYDVNGKVSSIS
jgi:hypothetical protein